jgi:hypothetical protein
MSGLATPPIDEESRQRPREDQGAGSSTEHPTILESEKHSRKSGTKRTKHPSASTGQKQATLETFSKTRTQPVVVKTATVISSHGQNVIDVNAVELEQDLNYERRKRQRTVSPDAGVGQGDTASSIPPSVNIGDRTADFLTKADAGNHTGTTTTLPWDAQLRVEADKTAGIDYDAVLTKDEAGARTAPTKHSQAGKHDPAAELLKEVEALEQARRSSTPKSIFVGTKWTSEQTKQLTKEMPNPSSTLKLLSWCATIMHERVLTIFS